MALFVDAFQLYTLLLILVSVLILSLVERRMGIPPLLGAVFVGIIMGPSFINFIQYNQIPEWLNFFALMGGMLILFLIGLDTNIAELVKVARKASVVTFLGMVFPAIYVFILGTLFLFGKQQIILLIAAAVVTATPTTLAIVLSIKKSRTRAARYLHASTILDNIVGVFFLFFIVAVHETGGVNWLSLFSIIFTLGVLIAVSYSIMPRISRWIFEKFGAPGPQTRITIAFSFVLFFGAISANFLFEAAFGAFLAGVMLSEIRPHYKRELMKTITDIGEGLFFPLFFLTIGLAVNISSVLMSTGILVFLVLYTFIAIAGKYMGGYYGSLSIGLNKGEARAIGAGLIPRGGIGLIVAQVGLGLSLFTEGQYTTVVLMTFATTVVGALLVQRYFSELK